MVDKVLKRILCVAGHILVEVEKDMEVVVIGVIDLERVYELESRPTIPARPPIC